VLPACVGGCRLAPVSSLTAVVVSGGDVKESAARRSNSHQWVRSVEHAHGALWVLKLGALHRHEGHCDFSNWVL
jgi:hypothetical protein